MYCDWSGRSGKNPGNRRPQELAVGNQACDGLGDRERDQLLISDLLGVAELIADGHVRLVDGTLLGCANYAGCASKSEFAGYGAYGYCASKSQWYWGMRLLLVTDCHGAPLGYDLRPANENEREGVFALSTAHPGSVLFADAGHRGREHHDSLQLIGVRLIVPEKHKLGERPAAEIAKARIRLVIESVFSTLKRQMRMETHLAKTLPGLAQRVIQRLLALTLGMLINTILDRPPRALAAYDGR